MSWCIPIVAAAITASATITVFVMNKYFAVRSNLPTTAETLLNSIKLAIAHTEQIAKGGNVYGRHHVTLEEFHAFRANLWFWQMRKPENLWKTYSQTHDPTEQLSALTNLQKEIQRRYRS